MPSIHYLNPPPNPFWDFVANIEDHPFFAAYGAPPAAQSPHAEAQPQPEPEISEKGKGKQPYVEDPPEIDPSALKAGDSDAAKDGKHPEEPRGMPFRGRGRFGWAFADDNDGTAEAREGRNCRGRGGFGRGGFGPRRSHGGPPPFAFGPPWFAPQGPPPPPGHDGPHGGAHPRWPPHHAYRPQRSPDQHGHRHPSPPHHGRQRPDGFNLGQFLNKLGEHLGIDVSGAAEGLGFDRFTGPRANPEVDFEPRADIFEKKTEYTIHLSLPGAKKEDVGVDYDGENSVLRVAGVVHRPGVDEEMLKRLVVDGRKRETGVFEKTIRLGTKRDPARVDVAGISAKMTDGVLIITVPRVEVQHKKREVPIYSSATPSPEAHDSTTIFDADQEMYETTPDLLAPSVRDGDKEKETRGEEHEPLNEETPNTKHAEALVQKEKEAAEELQNDQSMENTEQLPAYGAEKLSDWEKDSDDEEGEFVKINVV